MSEIIDNRAHRLRTLKRVIEHLHSGQPAAGVKSALEDMVRHTEPAELMAMEQELLAGGMKTEQLLSMCDLHSQVVRETQAFVPLQSVLAPGHPVDTFRRENVALREATSALRATFAQLSEPGLSEIPEDLLFRCRKSTNDLTDIDKHYQRKEHALFSKLEKYGITGPSKVMWAKDDEVRDCIRRLEGSLRQVVESRDLSLLRSVASGIGATTVRAVNEMIDREENILFPMSLNTLTEEDWADIWASSPKYGWCLVEPREGWQPSKPVIPEALTLPASDTFQMPGGHVSLQQLTAILSTLPVDLTFVDADDRVAFFSEGPQRVFARSKAIVGRKVQNCHPPKSVDVVDRILHDFRTGAQDIAEFWIEFHGRFVHIRYFAVRDPKGTYLGTLEVTQDVSGIRALTGERRLLEYTTPTPAVAS